MLRQHVANRTKSLCASSGVTYASNISQNSHASDNMCHTPLMSGVQFGTRWANGTISARTNQILPPRIHNNHAVQQTVDAYQDTLHTRCELEYAPINAFYVQYVLQSYVVYDPRILHYAKHRACAHNVNTAVTGIHNVGVFLAVMK